MVLAKKLIARVGQISTAISGHHAAADELERMIQDVRQHTGARVSRTIDLDEIAAASFPDRPS